MKCPKCNKPTTNKDYYWHKGWIGKIHPECRDCVKKRRKESKQQKAIVVEGMFNIDQFQKQNYNY